VEQVGLEADRINMYNLSSAMAGEFVLVVKEMTKKVIKLGPNPLKKSGTQGE
jgi:F420-non-reducing hydrogenase iron-sulfur subunit